MEKLEINHGAKIVGVINVCKPFVKWAGGKSQLLNEIRLKYPANIEKYCEPFVGGGAVLFDILEIYNPKKVLINDINKELINTYCQIKNSVQDVIKVLKKWQNIYNDISEEERQEIYNIKRNNYNKLIVKCNDKDLVVKAALFIFLNKTCFNGLYRVNSEGLYNVPKGKYKKPVICDETNLIRISELLKSVEITCTDFEKCEKFIDSKTFVYIDPPYRPLTTSASFTSYAKEQFDDNDQLRLGNFIDRINDKGAKIVLSNSDPKNVDKKDNFFDDLYRKYNIKRINAKRVINSKGTSRGNVTELLVANY